MMECLRSAETEWLAGSYVKWECTLESLLFDFLYREDHTCASFAVW